MTTEQYIAILALVAIFSFLLQLVLKQKISMDSEREKELKNVINKKGKKKSNVNITIYNMLSSNVVTRKYINHIKKRMDIFYPSDYQNSIIKTTRIFLLTAVVVGVVVLGSLFFKISLYSVLVCLFFAFVITDQIHYRAYRYEKYALEKEFDSFLSYMMNQFFAENDLLETMEEGAQRAGKKLRAHIGLMIVAMDEEETDAESKIRRYCMNAPFRAMKDFFVLVCSINQFGDKKLNDESVFLKNMEDIQEDLRDEMLHQEKEKYISTGWAVMVSLPLLSLPFIEGWGIYCLPVLYDFYHGRAGILTMILLFFTAFVIYNALMQMLTEYEYQIHDNFLLRKLSKVKMIAFFLNKQTEKNYGQTLRMKKKIKQGGEHLSVEEFLLKKVIYAGTSFLILFVMFNMLHISMKYRYLNDFTQTVDVVTNGINPKGEQDVNDIVQYYTKRVYSNQSVVQEIPSENKRVYDSAMTEIYRRIAGADGEYFKWYEFVICLMGAYLGFLAPNMMLKLKVGKMNLLLQEEVIELQSVIVMLSDIPSIGRKELFYWLESISEIVQPVIQETISRMDLGEVEAIEWLKKEEVFPPFQNLINKVLVMDKIGIKQAFMELREERRYARKRRNQMNQIALEQKGEGGGILAFIPIMLVVMMYIVVPFMQQALSGYSSTLNSFNS